LLCTVPRQTMDTGGKVDGTHDSTSRFHTQDGLRCILQYRQYTRRILTGNDLLIEKLGRVKCIGSFTVLFVVIVFAWSLIGRSLIQLWGALLLTLLSSLLLLLLLLGSLVLLAFLIIGSTILFIFILAQIGGGDTFCGRSFRGKGT
jgi:hypothetical protein